ncbi:MAG: SAM-dependent chlorinase/fluorinase [Acidobacteriaceae bacterium]|nr:SAM-dependent chlorinase/fluorinase [Acidobacteriaceae bacterium]MBV9780474.1 SAM-dependent chlorinase/fluorinase [Acidobacteriaceae bacterium]
MKSARPRPIVTLTTDFGSADHYVGTMKGVLLARCPGVEIVDISHEIPPFSIPSGAYTIDQAARYFPSGTVHVIVVDPGVGTARKPLLLEALGQFFVAPDNGILTMIFDRDPQAKAREITARNLWNESVSSTFHGRDIFAPVAAALACGINLKEVGPKLAKIVRLPDLVAREMKPGEWRGTILSVDRFGNVITNFEIAAFRTIASSPFSLHVRTRRVTSFQPTFGAAGNAGCFAYFGSSGYIEIGMNRQSAAAHLKGNPGDPLTLTVQSKRQRPSK